MAARNFISPRRHVISSMYCVRRIRSSLYYNDLNLQGTFHFLV